MRKLLMIVFLTAGSVFAGGFGPVFSASVEKPVGFSWYDLEHTGPEEEGEMADARPMIRSELNFPLDPFRLTVGLSSYRGADSAGKGGLRTEVDAWSAVGPAFFRMRDEDWVGARADADGGQTSKVLVKFSDTYSKAETFQFGGSIHRELGRFGFFGIPWVAGIGAGGDYYTYEIFGFKGKQRDENGDWLHAEISESVKGLTYWTYSIRAVVGLRPEARLLGLDWESRIHPVLYSRSLDDHLLRKKEIGMQCWGAGGVLEASLPLGPQARSGGRVGKWAPYVRAELDRAWGNMMQTYYADSNDTPEDETGQSTNGIRTTVNHWLVAAGLRLNLGI